MHPEHFDTKGFTRYVLRITDSNEKKTRFLKSSAKTLPL